MFFLRRIFRRENNKIKVDNEAENNELNSWFIEYEDKIIGELLNPKFEDMFWVSYDIVSFNDKILFNEKLWGECIFKFKHKRKNEYCESCFSAIDTSMKRLKEGGRIHMRGLYLER